MLSGTIIQEEHTRERRILPIYFPPPIVTYLDFPFQLSILLAREKTRAWFYTNYIQIFSKLDSNPILLLHFWPDQYLVQHTQYFIDVIEVNETVMKFRKDGAVQRIRRWLDHGFYVSVMLSESRLPGTMFYGRGVYPHPQFFFGYDRNAGIFKLTNFDARGNYSIIDVTFSSLEEALSSPETREAMSIYNGWGQTFQGKHPMTLYKFREREDFQYRLDPLTIADLLDDYLNGNDTSAGHALCTPRILEYGGSRWGMGVYENLVTYMQRSCESMPEYRPFHGLWEHKKVMSSRLRYLEEAGALDPGARCAERYGAVENRANTIRLLLMKSLCSGEPLRRSAIIAHLSAMAAGEESLLGSVSKMLRSGHKRTDQGAGASGWIGINSTVV